MFPETTVEDPSLRYMTEDVFAKAQEIIRAIIARC
jgi:hypothetical protein